ncbi:MAG: aspartate/glutamate racemase family protein [Clostridiaceae bacterium]|nr:aspartate/glutamate racemase family protein [Eubacteriales bacterium]
MLLRVIDPVTGFTKKDIEEELETMRRCVHKGTELELISLDNGFPSIESELSHTINSAETVIRAIRAMSGNCDGIFVNCFDDPAVIACREALSIPVYGGYIPSMLTAMSLGERIAVITTDERCIPNEERKARMYGLDGRLKAVSSISISVVDLLEKRGELTEKLADECERLYRRYRINAVCLGCTVMSGVIGGLRKKVNERGCNVQVVDPMTVGIRWLENIVELGYSNSLGLGLDLEGLKWSR